MSCSRLEVGWRAHVAAGGMAGREEGKDALERGRDQRLWTGG